jgi:LacI family transcriptional regulator
VAKEINSTEIARLAGVSRSTVSRVINNYANVPEHTRQKVMKVIAEHNYYPNLSAQVLAGKRTRTIGLFMIDPGRISGDMISSLLLARIIESASSRGYYVLTHIVRDTGDPEEIRMIKESFFQRRIDGGVFIGAANEEAVVEELIAEGFVVALVDQHLPGRSEPNRLVINFDNQAGISQLVAYLAGLGHRHIGVINGDMNRHSGPAKWEAFQSAMAEAGLSINPQWVLSGDFNETSGYNAMKQLLAATTELPTALLAANDSAAFGALRALREAGLHVPEDMSIVGFDDHSLSAYTHPPLTTVRVDFAAMMDELTRRLIATIEQGAQAASAELVVATQLVVRYSCQPIVTGSGI